MFWGLVLIIFGVVSFFVNYINTLGFSISGGYLENKLKYLMYNNMIRQEVGYFDGDNKEKISNPGVLSAKFNTDSHQISNLNPSIGIIIQQIISFVSSFIIAFYSGWKLTLILLSICPILIFDVYLSAKSIETRNMENRKLNESCSKVVFESINNIKTVYSLNLHEYCIKSFNEKAREPVKRLEKKMKIGALAYALSALSVFIPYIMGYYFLLTIRS